MKLDIKISRSMSVAVDDIVVVIPYRTFLASFTRGQPELIAEGVKRELKTVVITDDGRNLGSGMPVAAIVKKLLLSDLLNWAPVKKR